MATDPFAPAKRVQAFARVADSASAKILGFLIDNPQAADADLWRRMMRELDSAAARLDADALRIMGLINDEALAAIKDATTKAEAFTQETADIKKGLQVFAGVLGLAGALMSGAGTAAIVKAAKAVRDAAKAGG
jgi:hypothetical protein